MWRTLVRSALWPLPSPPSTWTRQQHSEVWTEVPPYLPDREWAEDPSGAKQSLAWETEKPLRSVFPDIWRLGWEARQSPYKKKEWEINVIGRATLREKNAKNSESLFLVHLSHFFLEHHEIHLYLVSKSVHPPIQNWEEIELPQTYFEAPACQVVETFISGNSAFLSFCSLGSHLTSWSFPWRIALETSLMHLAPSSTSDYASMAPLLNLRIDGINLLIFPL